MAFSRDSAYHADSDADDEFERSVMTSPTQVGTDSETEISSNPRSNQHTPTKFVNHGDDSNMPGNLITEWTTDECAHFLTSLDLRQYCDVFVDNGIDGEALIALKHEELKEMGITSLGHRLKILKKVYDLKVSHDVPVESDDFVPLSAEHNPQHEMATKEDIARLARSIIRLRDERIAEAEAQLTKLASDYRKLRQDLLPVFKMAKEHSAPLPVPYSSWGSEYTDGIHSPPGTAQSVPEKTTTLSRSFSKKLKLNGPPTGKASPTHIPTTIRESRTLVEPSNLTPSAAANQASNSLSGAMHQQSPATSTIPSPTSPLSYHHQHLSATAYRGEMPSLSRFDALADGPPRSIPTPTPSIFHDPPKSAASTKPQHSLPYMSPATAVGPSREQSASVPPSVGRSGDRDRNSSHTDGEAPSVEIFKSFRVALEDPCHKVLPAALRKYNINADWRLYALYIVYGDQERCVGLDEKPLALFKDLDREGKRPMFMLRKLGNPIDTSQMPGTAQGGLTRPVTQGGLGPTMGSNASIRSMVPGSALPGGVL